MAQDVLTIPQEVANTGVRRGMLEDLALKILYLNGEMSLVELAERMCLGLGVAEELFEFFRKEHLCEVKGMSAGTHRIVASGLGKDRAARTLGLNQYAGPAPVSLSDYVARVRAQSVKFSQVTPPDLARAFSHMVVSENLLFQLGTAVSSGTSMFLYGHPGTGKTTLATGLQSIFQDSVWIPYAVEVDDQVITVYDPGVHEKSSNPIPEETDTRWVLCRRPRVFAGGELTAEMLDLQLNPVSKFCTAPLHMKANNGVFVLDDFGRQRIEPHELLNRWMTPLDKRLDYLTLPGGRKFEIPFDPLVVFSTNLNPLQLADEAFLRRIPNKIHVTFATEEQFLEILRRECERTRVEVAEEGVFDYILQQVREERKMPLCHCYPRDLVAQILAASRYLNARPQLTRETADWACSNYFVSTRQD